MSLYRDQLENFLKNFNITAVNLLDIGGSAYPLEKRVKTWDVQNYYIFDNNNEEAFHEKWKAPDVVGDICLPHTFWKWSDDVPYSFDYITMLEVAEYLLDPVQALRHVSSLLDSGGRFLSSWPTIYPLHQPVDSDRLRYSLNWIKDAFKVADLHIDITVPRKLTVGAPGMIEAYTLEGMRMAKYNDSVMDMGYIVLATKLN